MNLPGNPVETEAQRHGVGSMRVYLRHMANIWCRWGKRDRNVWEKIKDTHRYRMPVSCCDVFVVLTILLLGSVWFLAGRRSPPTPAFVAEAEMPYVSIRDAIDHAEEKAWQKRQKREAIDRPAPWMLNDVQDYAEEDKIAYRRSMHRALSPELLKTMTTGWFHASLSYAPWTLPAEPRKSLFRSMRLYLSQNPEVCAVAAPSFRVYVNLVAVRWEALRVLPTFEDEEGIVFLRNIHVTPVSPDALIPPGSLRKESNDMCMDGAQPFTPAVRYNAVYLTSDEIPQGIILSGDEAIYAQHYDDVLRGVWPCSTSQKRPRAINL